ncbi:MAG: hypothetical protein J7M25_15500 [Deltaproteobacteria bacterium]|nr:hypothetical protein [Deltaproteobacteria bacterium]
MLNSRKTRSTTPWKLVTIVAFTVGLTAGGCSSKKKNANHTTTSQTTTAKAAKTAQGHAGMPSNLTEPEWKHPKPLPSDFLKKCPEGWYVPKDTTKYRLIHLVNNYSSCFVLKYYRHSILQQEDRRRFFAQKGPLGDICLRPPNGKYSCQKGKLTKGTHIY